MESGIALLKEITINNEINTNTNTTIAITSATDLTMSSREIAELTGKRHDNVMADIRTMMDELEIHAPEFSGTYKTERGNAYECFNLPKDLTITLISGYNVKMRHAITKRWMELEAAKALVFAVPQTFGQALLLAAKLEEERTALVVMNAKQAETIALAAPKADFYDAMVEHGATLTPTEVATALHLPAYRSAIRVNQLMEKMGCIRDRGFCYQIWSTEPLYFGVMD